MQFNLCKYSLSWRFMLRRLFCAFYHTDFRLFNIGKGDALHGCAK